MDAACAGSEHPGRADRSSRAPASAHGCHLSLPHVTHLTFMLQAPRSARRRCSVSTRPRTAWVSGLGPAAAFMAGKFRRCRQQ